MLRLLLCTSIVFQMLVACQNNPEIKHPTSNSETSEDSTTVQKELTEVKDLAVITPKTAEDTLRELLLEKLHFNYFFIANYPVQNTIHLNEQLKSRIRLAAYSPVISSKVSVDGQLLKTKNGLTAYTSPKNTEAGKKTYTLEVEIIDPMTGETITLEETYSYLVVDNAETTVENYQALTNEQQDRQQPIINMPVSDIVSIGESYSTNIRLGTFVKKADHKILLNDSPVPLRNAVANCSLKPQDKGENNYKIAIKINNTFTGETETISQTFSYFVHAKTTE